MSFDLNIDNYTRHELIEMFELPEYFDRNIVEIKEAKLRDSIINNKQIKKDTQIQTINFLTKAKNIILKEQPHNSPLERKIENFYNSSYELKSSKLEDPQEHMVQLRPEKPYLSSYPSEFFPGIINPLKKRTIRKNLNIDTRFRDNYYANSSTNFNLTLPTNFNDVVQMQLTSIELPTTFYAISKQYGNNYFTIKLDLSDDTSESKVINIPDGNYTQYTIMEIINTQLSLSSTYFTYISFIINLTGGHTGSAQTLVGLNPSYTAATPSPSITSIELNFQYDRFGMDDRNTPLPLKLGWVLGFRNGVYTGNLNYVSEAVVDTTGPRYLFLVVDDYTSSVNNGFFSAFNSSVLNKNIIARISMQANLFNVLEQNNLNIVTTPREYFGPVNINNLTIQLLDEYGRIVDLNNMDFSFCLNLVTVYDI